jgi:two-component system, cell cycle sensor histidine kinase and response regulator CckA
VTTSSSGQNAEYSPPEGAARADVMASVLVRAVADAIVAIDTSNTVLTLNPAAERLFGASEAEMLGRKLTDIMPPDLARQHLAGFTRYLQTGVRRSNWEATDAFIRRLDTGELVPVTISFADHEEHGTRIFVAVLRNRTEQQRQANALQEALAAVQESESRYRDLVQHSGEILTSHALDGRLLAFNPAMLRSLRIASIEQAPASLRDIVPPRHLPGFVEYLERVRREGSAEGIGTVVAADGSYRVWQYTSSIRNEGVAEPVVRSIVTDVTDTRARDRLLADREERLRHAQKVEAVGKLAGGIAHDFNNILTVIAGHLALVRDESAALSTQGRADLDEVTRAVDRATRLTRRLLGFSRKQLLTPRAFDANTLIAELEPMLARVLDERIAFAAHLAPVPARIFIDPSVLEAALVNLAVNARDAMPDGGTLSVDTTVRGNIVTVAVRDSGSGMDPETLARAGEPFFTTKGPGVGTGLGLAMIFGSVEQSGGSVRIESKPGAGTEVQLLFPLASDESDAALITVAEDSADGGATSTREPSVARPTSVLVVEDEDALRRLVERILVREGYRVTVARHGADALQIAATMQSPVEILVTDLVMPEIGGRVVAETLRAVNPTLPVLFISGYDPDPVMLGASEQEHTSFLAKPFTGAALLEAVRQLASTARVRGA